MAVDLALPDGPAQLIRHATQEHHHLDVLVNKVGAVQTPTEAFFGTSDEDFAWAMQMNFFIARASRAALTAMVEQGTGAIVKVASVSAFFQRDAPDRLRRRQGRTGQPHQDAVPGIRPVRHRVNAVSPGLVATDLRLGEPCVAEAVARATGVDADTACKTIIAGIGGFATGRLTTPEEVGHIDHVPGLRPGSQHHRRQLLHRSIMFVPLVAGRWMPATRKDVGGVACHAHGR
jgi:NAD(P)-dependent dehydrogenase (short-subunit alcohol dehydrogenase family)